MPITHEWNGTILTITSDSGTSSADLKGEKGDDGARGAQGVAGDCIATDTKMLGGIVADEYATKDYVKKKVSAYNLLDNSDFRNPVNQRGQTSYTAVGYTFDRWVIQNTGSVIKVGNGGLQAGTSGTIKYLYQRVFLEEGKTYTLASETTDGDLCVITAVYNKASSWTWIKEANTNKKIYLGIASSGADFATVAFSNGTNTNAYTKWIALYEGAYTAETLPPYVPKGYAVELAECQRYYYKIVNDSGIYGYFGSSGTVGYLFLTLPQSMRIENVSLETGTTATLVCNGVSETFSSFTGVKVRGNQLEMKVAYTKTALPVRSAGGWMGAGAVSADL